MASGLHYRSAVLIGSSEGRWTAIERGCGVSVPRYAEDALEGIGIDCAEWVARRCCAAHDVFRRSPAAESG
jgi:hypothetical protein